MNTFRFLHSLDRFYMTDRQIDYMDIISDTCSIRCIVVIAKHSQTIQFSNCNLCNIWHQIVRDSFRIFSNLSGFVCPDRVKVTKQHNIPLRISCVKICQNLLQHSFCTSVWVGDFSFRTLFCDRDLCRISVYCCGRTEDHVLASVFSHHITKNQCSCNVVVIVFPRLFYRFSDCFESCKVDHCLDLFIFKDRLQIFSV